MIRHKRLVIKGISVAIVMVLATGCAYLDRNFRRVHAGRYYRSGQLPEGRLAGVIDRQGIRTVINLRGPHPEKDWYRRERAVCTDLAVTHHDLDWSGDRLPSPASLTQFITWCRESEQPILVHCHGGVHRTGIATACYLLAQGADLKDARRQLGVFFGDAYIGRVLDLYEESGVDFNTWLRDVYPSQYAEANKEETATAL